MDAHKQLTIGLFGFGVVGEGLYRILATNPFSKSKIKKVCIKHPGKKRNAPEDLFTTDKYELLNDPDINVIVEVINETEPAFRYCDDGFEKRQRRCECQQKNAGRTSVGSCWNFRKKQVVPFYMKQRPAHPFRSSATWKNIMTTICCIPCGLL